MKPKILFLAANPRDNSQLSLDKEIREIKGALRASNLGQHFELSSEWAVRTQDLQQVFYETDAVVVHYSGHGSKEHELLLMDEDDQAKPVSKEALAGLFKHLGGKVKMAFFNACYSQGQAEAVVEHVDSAIGMTMAVGDRAAIRFASGFYKAIGFGRPVQEAFDLGLNAIELEGIDEVDTPRLIGRKGVDLSSLSLSGDQEIAKDPDANWNALTPEPAELGSAEAPKRHVVIAAGPSQRGWASALHDALRGEGYESLVVDPSSNALTPEVIATSGAILTILPDTVPEVARTAERLVALGALAAGHPAAKDGAMGSAPQSALIRIDSAPAPEALAGVESFDFAPQAFGPAGGKLLELLFWLQGTTPPPNAALLAVEEETRLADAKARIEGATHNGDAAALRALAESTEPIWKRTATLGCGVAEGLLKLEDVDGAIALLDRLTLQSPRAIRPRQLQALALLRRSGEGDLSLAQTLLGGLVKAGQDDPETLGIYASSWMKRYEVSGDRMDLEESRDLYQRAFERSPDDTYTGINAAAKSALLGDHAHAKDLAARVLNVLDKERDPRKDEYWSLATKAEANLILQREEEASENYRKAVRCARRSRGSHRATWNQARELLSVVELTPATRESITKTFAHLGE